MKSLCNKAVELVNDRVFYLAPHKLYATEFYELCGGLNAINLLLSLSECESDLLIDQSLFQFFFELSISICIASLGLESIMFFLKGVCKSIP